MGSRRENRRARVLTLLASSCVWVLLVATALADGIPSACATLASELKDLKSQLASLQADLQQTAGGSQKVSIVAAIKKVNTQIATKQQELDACIAQNQHLPTPSPTYSFDTGTGAASISVGGSPADSNIAASSTHICLTARGAFACYTKGGTLVSPGPGYSARRYSAKEFFEQAGVSTIVAVDNNDPVKDGRVVFDAARRRLIMVFQTRESPARLLISVSKSEDPRDGWWAYPDIVGTAGELAHDYQYTGVNATHLLISDHMVSTWGGTATRTRHFTYTMADLSTGKSYTRAEWSKPAANGAVPCVHDSSLTDAFWVQRDDALHVSVWAAPKGDLTKLISQQVKVTASTGPVNGRQPGTSGSHGNNLVGYNNISWAPQNAQYRNGRIVYASNDGHTWSGKSSPNNAVRLIRLDVSKYFDPSPSMTVEIDRVFGLSSAATRRVPSSTTVGLPLPSTPTATSSSVRSGRTRRPTRSCVAASGSPEPLTSVPASCSGRAYRLRPSPARKMSTSHACRNSTWPEPRPTRAAPASTFPSSSAQRPRSG